MKQTLYNILIYTTITSILILLIPVFIFIILFGVIPHCLGIDIKYLEDAINRMENYLKNKADENDNKDNVKVNE